MKMGYYLAIYKYFTNRKCLFATWILLAVFSLALQSLFVWMIYIDMDLPLKQFAGLEDTFESAFANQCQYQYH